MLLISKGYVYGSDLHSSLAYFPRWKEKTRMKTLKKTLTVLLIIAVILLVIFLAGRYGWKLGGFRAC